MSNSFSDTYALMMSPWTQAWNYRDWAGMMQEAQEVIAARIPMILQAYFFPFQADYGELGLMWSEKSAAFSRSAKAIQRAARHTEMSVRSQKKAVAKARAGGMMTVFDLFNIYQRNLSAMASLASLPANALKPVKTRVTANVRRLAKK
ncbi:MAG: hypothetical protein R3E04_03510 [Sphingobium sp.]